MRKIIITSNKYIPSKGIDGPVLTPYMETKKEICKMLARGIVVEEVLDNGEHRKLDIPRTLEDDNNTSKKEVLVNVKPEVVKTNTVPKVDNISTNNVNNNNRKDKKKNKKQRQELGFEVDTFEAK